MTISKSASVIVLGFLSACKGPASRSEPENIIPVPSAIGMRTGTVNVRSLRGLEVGRLARALRGRGTLVNIWATWCGSCKGELPMMQQLASEYGQVGLNVALVSVDEPEENNRLSAWVKSFGFGLPVWVAARPLNDFKSNLAKNWQGNIPVTFLYDAQGKRRFFWNGPVSSDEVKPIIEGFLAGKAVDGERHYALSAGATE